MINHAPNRLFLPDHSTRRQIEIEENAPEAALGLPMGDPDRIDDAFLFPSEMVEPDYSCIHCGHRTTYIDNVCLRCRNRKTTR